MRNVYQLDYLFAGGGYIPKMTRAFKFRDWMTDALSLCAALGALTTYLMVISTVHNLYRYALLFLAKPDYIVRNADEETLEQEYQTYMGPQAITYSHRQTQRVWEDFIFLGTFQIFGTPEQDETRC